MTKKIDLLNQLLEAEKAGVVTLEYFKREYQNVELPFNQIKDDEAWSTAGLIESVKREGGAPSTSTGDFADKVIAKQGLIEQLSLLNKGQSWVVRKIDEVIELGVSMDTIKFLVEMKVKHLENIQACQTFIDRQ